MSYSRYIISFTNKLCSVDVSVSVDSNNIFDKNGNCSLCKSKRLPYDVNRYQKMYLLTVKNGINSGKMNAMSFLFIGLYSFNFLGLPEK